MSAFLPASPTISRFWLVDPMAKAKELSSPAVQDSFLRRPVTKRSMMAKVTGLI